MYQISMSYPLIISRKIGNFFAKYTKFDLLDCKADQTDEPGKINKP